MTILNLTIPSFKYSSAISVILLLLPTNFYQLISQPVITVSIALLTQPGSLLNFLFQAYILKIQCSLEITLWSNMKTASTLLATCAIFSSSVWVILKRTQSNTTMICLTFATCISVNSVVFLSHCRRI